MFFGVFCLLLYHVRYAIAIKSWKKQIGLEGSDFDYQIDHYTIKLVSQSHNVYS